MKRTILASLVGAVLAVGGIAAPAAAGSGSTTDSDGDGRSVRMTVTTPTYVTINRDGFTKVPVTAKLSFSGPGEFTGWWADGGTAVAESINGAWSWAWADFSSKVATTKKTTIRFRKFDHLEPQRLAVGAELTPVYGESWLYPFDDHLTTVHLRNERRIVGADAYRAKVSRAVVRVRGTLQEDVWRSATSDDGVWKGRKGVRVAVQFDPRGAGSWRTVKHVTTGQGGEIATSFKRSKAGSVRLVVEGTKRATPASARDGVGAR
ncbi:hypothetical protein GCM10023216_00470 [Isoptericola chiayiensis]|uniref:Uncharacterized protein n=1 Tax=Isoptericola chiayiensis TaxID=579446 RepID=A0ABP8XYW4_9MICO|nr:hypothetical protein [Isoptericola chiayiensis]NOW02151.1 hypothetical protein [Isoptericola chiayiensis]